ncbi:uncharacterized protein [Antedon mediterranea]|uniref:uncharacterized protein isoform X2 n=1 Tax=Antedon mediterranea TaxID=105859 RepID=UPI003AF44388
MAEHDGSPGGAASSVSDKLKEELINSMSSMVASMKQDLVQQVKDMVGFTEEPDEGQSYMPVWSDDELPAAQTAQRIDEYTSGPEEVATAIQTSDFADLAAEFSTATLTGPAVDDKLATIVSDLISGRIPPAKMTELTGKYLRPLNCEMLITPKVNLLVWGQLKPSTRTNDVGLQKVQALFVNSMYALLQACHKASGDLKTTLTHALVIALTANREFNLKRREMLKPDLNAGFVALCGVTTPITTELFGDDVTKQIDDLFKSNKLGEKLSGARRGRGRGYHPYAGARRVGFRGRGGSRSGFQRYQSNQSFLGGKGSYQRRQGARLAAQPKGNRE